jgi:hypothetical protein
MASTFNDPGFDFGTAYVADAAMVYRRGAKSQVFVGLLIGVSGLIQKSDVIDVSCANT